MRTPVGDRYVLEHMREHGYNVGGEPSGHIILSDYTTTGDGFVAALQVLAVVKKLNKPVSQACHRFDALPQVLKNVRYRSGKPLKTPKCARRSQSAEHRLNGHGRLVVRPSGTEPVIRVMGEGDDKAMVEEIVDGIVDALDRARGVILHSAVARRYARGGRCRINPPRFQKLRERLQRDFRDVVLDAFGVGLGGFGRHAERAQQIDHQPVAHAHAVGERVALFGQEHAAIGPRGRQAGALEARDGLDRGGVRDAEPPGDVGRPRLALARQQIRDQFGIVLEQRGRLRRPRLAEAARLGAFRRKLCHAICA